MRRYAAAICAALLLAPFLTANRAVAKCEPVTCVDYATPQPIVAWTAIDPLGLSDFSVDSAEVLVDGSHAWVTNAYLGGLSRYDISDPFHIRLIEYFNRDHVFAHLARFGDMLVSVGSALEIYDVGGSGSPRLISSAACPGADKPPMMYRQQLLVPDHAYVHRFDISDPSRPVRLTDMLVGELPEDGLFGDRAVTVSSRQLRICDATAFPNFRALGYVNLPEYIQMAVVSEGMAFIATSSEISIYDVISSTTPRLVATMSGYHPIEYMKATSTKLAFGDRDRGLVICDVSKPSAPREITCSQSTRGIQDIEPLGEYYLVTTRSSVLQVVDSRIVSAAVAPVNYLSRSFSAYGNAAQFGDVAAIGNFTINPGNKSSLMLLDMSDPHDPEILGEVAVGVDLRWLEARGSLLFTTGLGVFDMVDPAFPRPVVTPRFPYSVAIHDTVAVTGVVLYGTNQVTWWGMGDPRHPQMLGTAELEISPAELAFEGSTLIAASWNRLLLAELTNSQGPRRIGSMTLPINRVHEMKLKDHLAYVVGDCGTLVIVDVSDPAHPKVRSHFVPPGTCLNGSVAVGSGYAYLNSASAGVMVLDVRNPDEPRWVGTIPSLVNVGPYDLWDIQRSSLTLLGDNLMIGNPRCGVAVVPRHRGDVVPTHVATIDVEPGDPCHRVPCGLRAHGLVEVAVISTAAFDATTIDPASVRFGPAGAVGALVSSNPGQGHGRDSRGAMPTSVRDVDCDGDQDLLLRFDAADLGFACGDSVGSLTAMTTTGIAVCADGPVTAGPRCHRGTAGGEGGRTDDYATAAKSGRRGFGCDGQDADKLGGALDVSFVNASLSPNPFNPRTTIEFAIAAQGRVLVEVFDIAGRRMAVLADATCGAGTHRLDWEGVDDGGRAMPSGVYFVRISGDASPALLRAVLLR